MAKNRSALSTQRAWSIDGVFFGLTILALALFLIDNRQPVEQMDDAYISFQYARNLAAGHGLVFNIGERVEGFTNLSWTLLIALGMKLGFTAPEFCRALSLISSAFLLIATGFYTALLLPRERRWLAGIAPLILLASNAFACWTVSGLETTLFALFIVLALYDSLRARIFAVVGWCVLASLTRPEGALYAALLLGCHWLLVNYRLPDKKFREILKNTYPILLYLAFVVCYTGWRLWYYGDPLPNTFYSKAGGIPLARGIEYVWAFAADGPGLLFLPACIAALKIPAYRIAAICVVVTAIYSMSIGGDVFHLGRFFLPILPALIAGALAGASLMWTAHRAFGIAMGLLLLASVGWSLFGPASGAEYLGGAQKAFPALNRRVSAQQQNQIAFGGVRAEKALLQKIITTAPPVKQVAAIGIGQLAFFSEGIYWLDLVGLVDKHIARSKKTMDGNVLLLPGHQRTDSDYVLDRQPDAIIIPKKDQPFPFLLPAIYDLWHNPRLEQLYYWDDSAQIYRLKPLNQK